MRRVEVAWSKMPKGGLGQSGDSIELVERPLGGHPAHPLAGHPGEGADRVEVEGDVAAGCVTGRCRVVWVHGSDCRRSGPRP